MIIKTSPLFADENTWFTCSALVWRQHNQPSYGSEVPMSYGSAHRSMPSMRNSIVWICAAQQSVQAGVRPSSRVGGSSFYFEMVGFLKQQHKSFQSKMIFIFWLPFLQPWREAETKSWSRLERIKFTTSFGGSTPRTRLHIPKKSH